MPFDTDVRVVDVAAERRDYPFRQPLRFGVSTVTVLTLLEVTVTVENRAGGRAAGVGEMPLGNAWSFPSQKLSYDETLAAMNRLADALTNNFVDATSRWAHPLHHGVTVEEQVLDLAAQQSAGLPDPIPSLCALVVASSFDAAIHDAFGKVNNVNTYQALGPEYVAENLGAFLTTAFSGHGLDLYINNKLADSLALYHLVGALDPLTRSEVEQPLDDGYPESLDDWIDRDGLTHFKIKLDGDDINWDVERIRAIHDVTSRKIARPAYSLDFNEKCESPQYVLDAIDRLQSSCPDAATSIHYIEQPLARDLAGAGAVDVSEIAERCTVVIDESLTNFRSLEQACDLGYSGVALKTCKGQTQALLMSAAAQHNGMFLCVQDLTCPGRSFLHSAGLAARLPGVTAVEGNARQFIPAANEPWIETHGDAIRVRNGRITTSGLTEPGLGH